MTSSGTSKLAKTFWTSSRSSRASIRRNTLRGAVLVELDLHVGHELRLGGVVVDAGGLQRRAYGDQVAGLGDHLERLPQVVDVLGARVEGRLEHVVLGDRPCPPGRPGRSRRPCG